MKDPKPRFQENVPLAPLTTLQVGGPARYFLAVENEDQLVEALTAAGDEGIEVFILGGGSNILISDNGFDGLVLQIAMKGIVADETGDVFFVTAAAGEDWDSFVNYCVDRGYSGVECLSGIPGFVGGTPVQNVGAYGQDVSETIVEVRCLDRTTREIVTLSNADCGFSYRKSIFNSTQKDRFIVLAVKYALKVGGAPKLVYRDLIEYFGDAQPSLREVREAVLAIRRSKSMVIDAGDPNAKSAGSFFKNPVISLARYAQMVANSEISVPNFKADPGTVKIPAAWLIEHAGFSKGFVHGNVGISSKHSLAIINRGGASAAEILELRSMIQKRVREEFAVDLETEPVFVGF